MDRRTFLRSSAALSLGLTQLAAESRAAADEQTGRIMTVLGPIKSDAIGIALTHEHVMSMFGADPTTEPRYDIRRLNGHVLPYLRFVRELGVQTLMDCTTAYFGRDPKTLARLSRDTGLHILTNTGYYGAGQDRYVPAHARQESPERIAERWLDEWERGIDGTGIRPGFIKLGVDSGPLSEIDARLIAAGAIVHRKTGLVLAVHTGDNAEAALAQLVILEKEAVGPAAWIWVHAHSVKDRDALLKAAGMGAWISCDGLSADTAQSHLDLLSLMKERKLLNRVLLSHDGNSLPYGNRAPRPYDMALTYFRWRLLEVGFSEQELHQLFVDNPREAFTIRIRGIGGRS